MQLSKHFKNLNLATFQVLGISQPTHTYTREKLLEIVSNNSSLNALDQSIKHNVSKLNTIPKGNRQRGKRCGKLKTIVKPNRPNLANLIYPKRCNLVSNINEKLTCATLKCRSAMQKDSFFR